MTVCSCVCVISPHLRRRGLLVHHWIDLCVLRLLVLLLFGIHHMLLLIWVNHILNWRSLHINRSWLILLRHLHVDRLWLHVHGLLRYNTIAILLLYILRLLCILRRSMLLLLLIRLLLLHFKLSFQFLSNLIL
jgi:hypothetical protein